MQRDDGGKSKKRVRTNPLTEIAALDKGQKRIHSSSLRCWPGLSLPAPSSIVTCDEVMSDEDASQSSHGLYHKCRRRHGWASFSTRSSLAFLFLACPS